MLPLRHASLWQAASVAERVLDTLGGKVVVKPCSNGSAIGVARFSDGGEGPAHATAIAKAVEAAWAVDEAVLIERFQLGREVTCGICELRDPAYLPPTEVRASKDAFYTYQARYAPGRSEHLCPAPLGGELVRRVQEIALAAHRALGCRDLSRVDFVVGDVPGEEVTLLEVNTLPGFTETSLYPEAAGVAGIPMRELCSTFAIRAAERGPTRRNEALPLPK